MVNNQWLTINNEQLIIDYYIGVQGPVTND